MSVITLIHYVSEDPSSPSAKAVSEILNLFSTEKVTAVYRAKLGRRWPFGRKEPELVGHFCSVAHAAESYRRGTRVHIDAGGPPRIGVLSGAISKFFPKSVLDGYSPGNLEVVVGKSKLYDVMFEDEENP